MTADAGSQTIRAGDAEEDDLLRIEANGANTTLGTLNQRLTLSARLTAAMVALVLLTASAVGFVTYRNLKGAIVPAELGRLQEHANRRIGDLDAYVSNARADVRAMLASPAVEAFIAYRLAATADPQERAAEARWARRIPRLFAAQLAAKPSYLKIRIIGVADDGREILRVDRSGSDGSIRVVPDPELQAKGDRGFFRDTIRLEPGRIHVSRIDLNQEHGAVEAPQVPVLRVAAPIHGQNGQPVGILIINIDMRPALDAVRVSAPDGGAILILDADGNYLVHPDRMREFGFDLGRPFRLGDDIPALEDAFAAGTRTEIYRDAEDREHGAAIASRNLAGGPRVAVVETLPVSIMLASAAAVARASLVAGSMAAAAAMILAVLFARSLTRPLRRVTEAVAGFTGGEALSVPETAGGEVGMLARAFAHMARDVQQRTDALHREIAERKLAQEEAGAARARERILIATVESSIRNSPDPIVTIDLDGRIVAWNPAAESLYGYTAQEAIGQPVSLIAAPQRQELVPAFIERVRNGETLMNHDTQQRVKDGRLIDASIVVTPFVTLDGELRGATIICRDVTEQNLAQEKFRLAVETCPGGIVMADAQGVIVLINAETEQMFGYTRDEMIGQKIEMLIPDALRARHVEHRAAFNASPSRRRMGVGGELYARRKDGSVFPAEVGLNPIRTRTGLLVMGVVIDVTAIRAAQQALAAQTEELKRSNADLEQFAYVASHDLQEPLRMVASYAELLAERYRGRLDDKADKYIGYAVEGAKRMQRLVNDLLVYSRVGTQGKPLVAVQADAVLNGVLHSLRRAIDECGATIERTELPRVMADEVQLGQVLQNLIANALKFRSDAPPRVRVSAEDDGGQWIFSVSDNGIGVAPQYSERIFQMFQRLHERAKYEGSGIGLAVAKKIVERHGGRIWLESEDGKGATFRFTMQKVRGDSP